jgi:hypothetical protein
MKNNYRVNIVIRKMVTDKDGDEAWVEVHSTSALTSEHIANAIIKASNGLLQPVDYGEDANYD